MTPPVDPESEYPKSHKVDSQRVLPWICAGPDLRVEHGLRFAVGFR